MRSLPTGLAPWQVWRVGTCTMHAGREHWRYYLVMAIPAWMVERKSSTSWVITKPKFGDLELWTADQILARMLEIRARPLRSGYDWTPILHKHLGEKLVWLNQVAALG